MQAVNFCQAEINKKQTERDEIMQAMKRFDCSKIKVIEFGRSKLLDDLEKEAAKAAKGNKKTKKAHLDKYRKSAHSSVISNKKRA